MEELKANPKHIDIQEKVNKRKRHTWQWTGLKEAFRILTTLRDLFNHALVLLIRKYLGRNWEVVVHYISSEANGVADTLVRICHEKPIGVIIFSSPPAEAAMSMLKDTQHVN
ncbi:hypothetical protein V6N11_077186 [Hibiscus sabdariffa]|uniref:RNase H type-1 domain-containing protein n=1 Tax=Hibiscus sabdariffa TaxID=183260 RepID=A0ABR2TD34_9ROSI